MSEWDAMSDDDKAYLIQYWRTVDGMAAYESTVQATPQILRGKR